MLNIIWTGFFFIAFITASLHSLLTGDAAVWSQISNALFDSAKSGFEIALGLTGILCLWMGLFKIAEQSGLMNVLAKAIEPLLCRIMRGVPRGHAAMGAMTMNIGANMLGLDNAATPMGIRAMQALQELNPKPDTATNAQIVFLVLNSASVTLLPVTIFLYRAQQGSANPAEVFLPLLLATSAGTLAGLFSVMLWQRIRIWDSVIMAYLFGYITLLTSIVWWVGNTPADIMSLYSTAIGNFVLFAMVILFLLIGWIKKINVYDTFIEGAKEGFKTATHLIPFLVAMLVAVGVFRACGALETVLGWIRYGVTYFGWDTQFVDALPTAFMKPLSGSGSRAMMLDAMKTHGVDSLVGKMAAIMQGSTETTFYVLAVYFGAVGIKNMRHTLACGLIADIAGLVAAIGVSYWFF